MQSHTLAEAIFGGIKVDNCLLMTNDIVVKMKSEDEGLVWEFLVENETLIRCPCMQYYPSTVMVGRHLHEAVEI